VASLYRDRATIGKEERGGGKGEKTRENGGERKKMSNFSRSNFSVEVLGVQDRKCTLR
jgi:hypothetical protein